VNRSESESEYEGETVNGTKYSTRSEKCDVNEMQESDGSMI
jgi:hypothetical protein